MKILKVLAIVVMSLLPSMSWASPDDPRNSVLVEAMQDELDRTMNELELADFSAPYYASFTVFEADKLTCSAQDGALLSSNRDTKRWLRISIRVGDYSFDSGNAAFMAHLGRVPPIESLPVDDDYHALRRHIWTYSDALYKKAVEVLEKKRALSDSLSQSDEDDVPSFTKQKPIEHVSTKSLPKIDAGECKELVRSVSGVYGDHRDINAGFASAGAANLRRYFLDSEGTFVYEPQSVAYIDAWARALAPDGMPVKHHFDHVAQSQNELPTQADMVDEAKRSAQLVSQLRSAEKAEAFSGPVLFSGTAASQLTWRLFGHELSGTPPPLTERRSGDNGRGLTARLGRRILPEAFDVVDDPTRGALGDTPLMGAYEVDHEGVPAQRVQLVEDGMLETLLMSRTPSAKFENSNGHGRSRWGGIRANVGNLIFEADGGHDEAALKKRLIELTKREGASHGFMVKQLDNPAATRDPLTSERYGRRSSGDHFSTTVVVRVNVDGSEELVRGLEVERPLVRDLKRIVAWGDTQHTINYVDVGPAMMQQAIATPALLFEELDVTARQQRFRKPPIVEAPQ